MILLTKIYEKINLYLNLRQDGANFAASIIGPVFYGKESQN